MPTHIVPTPTLQNFRNQNSILHNIPNSKTRHAPNKHTMHLFLFFFLVPYSSQDFPLFTARIPFPTSNRPTYFPKTKVMLVNIWKLSPSNHETNSYQYNNLLHHNEFSICNPPFITATQLHSTKLTTEIVYAVVPYRTHLNNTSHTQTQNLSI